MAWTFCTSGAVFLKAGLTESEVTGNISGAELNSLSDEAESIICDIARVDLVSDYANVKANGKQILSNLASNIIAQKVVVISRNEYNSQREMETVLDVAENDIVNYKNMIKEDKIKTYLSVT